VARCIGREIIGFALARQGARGDSLCSSTAGFHHAEKAWLRKERGIGRFKASESNCAQVNDRFNKLETKTKETL